MKPHILLNFDLPPLEAALQAKYVIHRRSAIANFETFLTECGPQISVVVSFGALPIGAEILDAMPKLKAIVLFSAGYDGLDLDLCKKRGLPVTTCSGANAGDVADMAFGLLLAVARNIPLVDRFVRAGHWTKENRGGGLRDGLYGSKLGILGLGAIGMQIARRASGFDMPVSYHNRKQRPDVDYSYEPDVMALARSVDHLIIACPLTDETRNCITRDVLRALGPKGILVNIARGGVVDEPALIESLKAGEILGAGLDVFADEPHVPAELRALDNVVMMAHHAGFTRRVFRDMGALVEENIARAIAGQELLNRVI